MIRTKFTNHIQRLVRTKFLRSPGVYMITSSMNGKRYIGSTVNLIRRKKEHIKALKQGDHFNRYMQNHYNKHGKILTFSILELCPIGISVEQLTKHEQYYVDTLDPEFNICRIIVNSTLGIKLTKEQCQKMRELATQQWENPEIREKQIEAMNSPEARKKHGETISGENNPAKRPENKQKISEGLKLYHDENPEAGEAISERMKQQWKDPVYSEKVIKAINRPEVKDRMIGENNPAKRPEVRAKMSKTRKGKPKSEEHKRKIGESQKGKIISEETKQKNREVSLLWWSKKKEQDILNSQ